MMKKVVLISNISVLELLTNVYSKQIDITAREAPSELLENIAF